MKKLLLTTLGATLFAINMMAQDDENAMLNYGINFLDVPYVAHTLEVNDNEELVINCDEVDCTTFVEYVLAMALSPTEDGQIAEGDFAENLTKIRYRDGKIDGYPSRLHYIADWVNNGVRNGFLEDITAIKSPDTQKVELSYMSTHPQLYKQLTNTPTEGLLWIKNGDIIAITTNTPGLDVAHLGIAFYADGKLSLLHASSTEKKVVVSKVSLAQMLNKNDKWTGIRVLRMKK